MTVPSGSQRMYRYTYHRLALARTECALLLNAVFGRVRLHLQNRTFNYTCLVTEGTPCPSARDNLTYS